jgi:hypothetical protein
MLDLNDYLEAERVKFDAWFRQSIRNHIAFLVWTLKEIEDDSLRFGFQELLDEYHQILEDLSCRKKEPLAGISQNAPVSSEK